jgi:hypothetical protein
MRLYQSGEAELIVEIEERLIALRPREQAAFVAVGLDRLLGLVAALDENGRLHIFQQHVPLGVFELGLMTQGSSRPAIVVADGGATIFVTDGASLVLTNPSGQVRKRLDAYYWIGRIACSPDGRLLVASDLETGVVRVYDGDLTPTRQRHAFDLVAAATQVQLMADLPPEAVAVGALALNNAGVLALALSGVICVTDVEQMDALPRPAPLF